VDTALDDGLRLGKPSPPAPEAPVLPSYSSSLNTSSLEEVRDIDTLEHKSWLKEQKDKSIKKSSPAFELFWAAYNSAPRKAGQSKAKAREAWKEALKVEPAPRLIEAAKKAVEEQHTLMADEEFCSPLPDAFRWLRDERFVVLLEAHSPTEAKPKYQYI